jgi:pimeloyl-ACP methyl ester carboxylesterase
MGENITRRHAMALVATAPVLLAEPICAATGAVDETGFTQIGGIDQWIGTRGNDVRNPVVLFLHGGPAAAESPFLEEFAPWEQSFTVVNWDQRGSGRTYGKNGPSTPGMSTAVMALDQLSEDAREVAQRARRRLSKKKIILVGHSWGAILGMHVVKRWPELFHAFVGTGLPVSWQLVVEGQERWALAQATAAGDEKTLKALRDAAALPLTDMKRFMAPGSYRFGPSDLDYLKIQAAFTGPEPYPTRGEVADWVAGQAFSFPRLAPSLFSFDARKLGPDFHLPFFVIEGQDDHIASFEAARAYMEEVRAPKKAAVAIAGGHFACFTNPTEFVSALRQQLASLAT